MVPACSGLIELRPGTSGHAAAGEKRSGVAELSPEARAAINEFRMKLRVQRRQVGDPSLRGMAVRINKPNSRYGRRTSASALQRALKTGRRLPDWELVEAMLGDGMGLEAEVIENVWRPDWIKVRDLEEPIN
jgi:hypothetical protein